MNPVNLNPNQDFRKHYLEFLLPVLILDIDSKKIFEGNYAASKYYGYSLAELNGMNISQIEADGEEKVDAVKKELIENKRDHWELRHRLASGEIRHVEVYSSPVQLPEMNLIVALIIDVNDKFITQFKLRESEARYRMIFNYSPVGISRTLPDGKVEFNDTFCDMLGYSREELNRLTWTDITSAEDSKRAINYLEKLVKTELDVARFQKQFIHRDGHLIDVDVSSFVQRDNDGNVESFIATAMDISSMKKHELELNKKVAEMELLNSISIEREMQMIHLKNEVNKLLLRLGEKEKYLIVD